jgi:hypothetical protein
MSDDHCLAIVLARAKQGRRLSLTRDMSRCFRAVDRGAGSRTVVLRIPRNLEIVSAHEPEGRNYEKS